MSLVLVNGDVVRVQVACAQGDQLGLNTLHFVANDIVGEPTLAQAGVALDTLLAPLYGPMLTSFALYYGLRLQVIDQIPRPIAETATGNETIGTAGDTPLPTQIAGVLAWKTAFAGRSQQGRIYIPFPDEDNNDEEFRNRPDPAYVLLLQNLGDALLPEINFGAAGNTGQLALVIYHEETNTYDRVEQAIARRKWGTQRKRGSYGAPNSFPPF